MFINCRCLSIHEFTEIIIGVSNLLTLKANKTATQITPKRVSGSFTSPNLLNISIKAGKVEWFFNEIPRKPLAWDTAMIMAVADVNPLVRQGDIKSTRNPEKVCL